MRVPTVHLSALRSVHNNKLSPLSRECVEQTKANRNCLYLFSFIHSHYRRHRREARLIDWVEGYQRAAVLSLTSALWLIRSIIYAGEHCSLPLIR